MGEGADRVSGDGAPGPGDVHRVAGEIDVLRHELGGMVAELDRRRHELLDLRRHVRRHPILVATVVTVGALLLGGAVALIAREARERRKPTRRAREIRDAFGRIAERPREVASQPSIGNKVATALGVAIATGIAKRLLERSIPRPAAAREAPRLQPPRH
jgi:hypothetical protein